MSEQENLRKAFMLGHALRHLRKSGQGGMPIFSRRRIQQMLDDLAGVVRPAQFIGRLNDKRFENALPAEAELALVWAAHRLGGFVSEPTWYSPDGRLPEG